MESTLLFFAAHFAHTVRGFNRTACFENFVSCNARSIQRAQTDRAVDLPCVALRLSHRSCGLLDALPNGVEMKNRPRLSGSWRMAAQHPASDSFSIIVHNTPPQPQALWRLRFSIIKVFNFLRRPAGVCRPAIRHPLIGLLLLFIARSATACPMCADAVASQADKVFVDRLTNGFGWSIAVLMCTPYLLFAGVTFLIIHSARRNRRHG